MIKPQLKTRQVCLFFIAFTTITKLFTLPSLMASVAQEDLWLCSALNVFLDLVTIFALTFVCRRQNLTFLQLLENNLGKTTAKVVIFAYFIYFLLKAYMPINEQKAFVELGLYITLTTDVYFIPFFLVAFYLATKRLRVLGRIADVVWIISIVGFTLLIALSVNNTDFLAVLPVGAQGVKNVAIGSYVGSNWYGEGAYFLFLIGQFAYNKRDGIKIILSYLASGIAVLLFMIIFYGIFTSIAFRQSFALTEIAKYTTVINNIGRFDYVGILLLLFSSVFALSVPIYFASKCLDYVFNVTKSWISPLIVSGILFLTTVFLGEYYASLQLVFSKYFSAYFLLMANVLPILTLFLRKKENNYATIQA